MEDKNAGIIKQDAKARNKPGSELLYKSKIPGDDKAVNVQHEEEEHHQKQVELFPELLDVVLEGVYFWQE